MLKSMANVWRTLSIICLTLGASLLVEAQQPAWLKCQGVLKNPQGIFYSGPTQVTFAVYGQPDGGGKLWSETHNLNLPPDGRFSVVLGEQFRDGHHAYLFTGKPYDYTHAQGLWVGVSVNNSLELPRRIHLRTAQPSLATIPSNLFGLAIMSPSNWPTVNIGALGKGSFVTWPYIEQIQGTYDWGQIDSYIASAQSHGLTYYYTNLYIPPWAAADQSTCSPDPNDGVMICTSTVSNLSSWQDYVTALVSRYKGQILMYELWNEPDQTLTFSGTVSDMISLTNAEHDIIRSTDPSALIASPSALTSVYMDSYWGSGGTTDVDVVSLHGYPDVLTNDVPESIGGFKTVPLKSLMVKYGIATKPLWDTEASWGKYPNASDNQDFRTAFVARHYILHWANDVVVYYWYAWDNAIWGTLWDPIAGILEPGVAYQQVENWLSGAQMPSGCSLNGGTLYNATYTCDLTLSNGKSAMAVWNTNGNLSYTAPTQYTEYQDTLGNLYSIPSNHIITIGTKPLLLQ